MFFCNGNHVESYVGHVCSWKLGRVVIPQLQLWLVCPSDRKRCVCVTLQTHENPRQGPKHCPQLQPALPNQAQTPLGQEEAECGGRWGGH